MRLSSGLEHLTFGHNFNQNMDGVSLPLDLQTLTFGKSFNHSLEVMTLFAPCQLVAPCQVLQGASFKGILAQVLVPYH